MGIIEDVSHILPDLSKGRTVSENFSYKYLSASRWRGPFSLVAVGEKCSEVVKGGESRGSRRRGPNFQVRACVRVYVQLLSLPIN